MENLQVQFLFNGLIAYSPKPNGKEAAVLVLNDEQTGQGHQHMPHKVQIEIRSGKIKSGEFPEDFSKGYYLTMDEKFQKSNDLKYVRLRSDIKPDRVVEGKRKIGLLQANSIGIPNGICEEVLTGNSKDLALRFHATQGVLRPYDKFNDPLNSPLDSKFNARKVIWRDFGSNWEEAYLPEVIEWLSPGVEGDEIVLTFNPLDGVGNPYSICLSPEENQSMISIKIQNDPTKYDFCQLGEDRYRVLHLERLTRFSSNTKPERTFIPQLVNTRDRNQIDDFCKRLRPFGREPIICYGLEILR